MKAHTKRIILYIAIAAVILICGIVAILIAPKDTPVSAQEHIDLGHTYLIELSYDKAVLEFTEAIEIEPMNADAYLGLAEAYAGMGDIPKAVEVLEVGYDRTDDERLKEMMEELQPMEEATVTSAYVTKRETAIASTESEIIETSKFTTSATETTASETILRHVTSVTTNVASFTSQQTFEITEAITETNLKTTTETMTGKTTETTTEETTEITTGETTETIKEEPEIDFQAIAEKYINDSEFAEKVVSIEIADYDNNGTKEAFFVERGKINSWGDRSFGTHFINSKGKIIDLATFFDDVYDLYDVNIYAYKDYKFFCVERCYNDEATDTSIYTVKNGSWHRPSISGNVRLFSIKDDVITCEKKGDYVNGKREYEKTKLIFDEEACEFSYVKK